MNRGDGWRKAFGRKRDPLRKADPKRPAQARSSWEDLPPHGFTAAMAERLAAEKDRRAMARDWIDQSAPPRSTDQS